MIMPKWSRISQSVVVLERENTNKGTLPLKRVRQGRKSSGDRHIGQTFRPGYVRLLQTHPVNALPSSIHRHPHVVTMDIYLHISGYSSA